MNGTGVIGAVGALLVIFVVLRLVVRRRLLVKYAALWLLMSVGLVVLALVPDLLGKVADLLGFAIAANFLFFAGFVILLLVTVQLSVELTAVERRMQRLAEELALLRDRVDGDS